MGTPTLVQYATFGSAQGNASSSRRLPMGEAVLSGNCVLVEFTCGDGETPTVTDDQSNTYTLDINGDDAGHGQRLFVARKNNCTNGPRTIILNGTAISFASGSIQEFYNVDTSASPLTGTPASATGTNANPKPASLTTGVDGALVLSCFIRDDSSNPIVSWSAPSGTLVTADVVGNFAAQYQIKTTAGAVQPDITWDSAAYSWLAVQVAYKSANAGTAPTKLPRIIGVHHQAVNLDGVGSSEVVQCPASHGGDMLYGAFIGVSADLLTAITDSSSNTWTATGANLVNGGSGNVRGFYVKAPTLSALLTLTLTIGGPGSGGSTFMFYECKGMDQTAPFDVQGTNTGTQAAGTSFAGASVTPLHANGLVFSTVGITSNTVTGATLPAGVKFISSTDPNEEVSPWPNDQNNGWSVYENPNLTAVQVTWSNDIHVDAWASIADAFKAADPVGLSQSVRNVRIASKFVGPQVQRFRFRQPPLALLGGIIVDPLGQVVVPVIITSRFVGPSILRRKFRQPSQSLFGGIIVDPPGQVISSVILPHGRVGPRVLRPFSKRVFLPATLSTTVGTITVSAGQALETDTANAVAWAPKNRFVGQASETDVANSIFSIKIKAIGQALETDTATVVTAKKAATVGQALETDTAGALTRIKIKTLGQATELDTAQAITRVKIVVVGQALEVDTAGVITWAPKNRLVGQALEIDTAGSVTRTFPGVATEVHDTQFLKNTGRMINR